MREAVYNLAIPDMAKHALRGTSCLCLVPTLFVMLTLATVAFAADWSGPEQQLARKIIAVTGPGAVSLTVENRSSLGRRESEIVQNGLHDALEGLGLHFVPADQAAATVTISLSENLSSYVWVAQIQQGAETAVVMVSVPRPDGPSAAGDSVPLTLRKIPLWTQGTVILDVAVLGETTTPTQIAVLDAEKVSLYNTEGGKWVAEQALPIVHQKPWPRDLRGRLIPGRDHLFDVYLPGVVCQSTGSVPLSLSCHDRDDPWPLVAGTLNGGTMSVFPSAGLANGASTVVPQMKAFFASTRNFFTGVLTPGVGKFTAVPKFYSAALLPRDKYTLWLFAATDGQVHMIDGVSDQAERLGWGSDLTSVRTYILDPYGLVNKAGVCTW